MNTVGAHVPNPQTALPLLVILHVHFPNSQWWFLYFFFGFQLFDFADKYRGKYDSSISVAQKYYRSVSGYNVRWQLFLTTIIIKMIEISDYVVGGQ